MREWTLVSPPPQLALILCRYLWDSSVPEQVCNVLVVHLCMTLCEIMHCSPRGSSIHGILQARILEWVAIPFFRGIFPTQDQTRVSCIAGRFFTV